MRQTHFVLVFLLTFVATLRAQAPTPLQNAPTAHTPQTARQALIEMFLGKDPMAFEKHLPKSAHQILIRKGESSEASLVQRSASIARDIIAPGQHVETFDEGSTLLVEQMPGDEKVEVDVEHDSLLGEIDEIEVSIHAYKNGEPEFIPVIPRLIFSLSKEDEIWRLQELTLAAHMPLTDDDYLKGLRKDQDKSIEDHAAAHLVEIATAEINYSNNNPDRGFTCKFEDLFPNQPPAAQGTENPQNESSPEPPPPPAWFSGDSSGYRFAISHCQGAPVTKYQVTAVPAESEPGLKAFCSNESHVIRFNDDGKLQGCFNQGKLLHPEEPAPTLPQPPATD